MQDSGSHAKKAAAQVISSQGGTYPEGGSGSSKSAETFDKNRGSDKGGSNAPTSTNAK